MLSRFIRYGASTAVSIVPNNNKLFPPPPPFVSYLRSFSSMTHSFNIHITPETIDHCSAHNIFKFMLASYNVGCYSISDYNFILSSLHKRHYDLTILQLAQRWENSLTCDSVFPNIDTWTILINCHIGIGNMRSAFSLFHKIIETGHPPTTSTLNDLFNGLCIRGQIYKAIIFYNYTILKGFPLNICTYDILIEGLCKIGETKIAIHLFREALQIDNDHGGLYDTIILRLCRDRLLKEAYGLLSEIKKTMWSTVYHYLIYGYCINGQFKHAIDLFIELEVKAANREGAVLIKKNNISTLVTEQEVKAAKRAATVLIKHGVKPDLASYQSVTSGLYKGGRVYKVARKVEELSLLLSRCFMGKYF